MKLQSLFLGVILTGTALFGFTACDKKADKAADGKVEMKMPDGTTAKVDAGGMQVKMPDGTMAKMDANGKMDMKMPDGKMEMKMDMKMPDGMKTSEACTNLMTALKKCAEEGPAEQKMGMMTMATGMETSCNASMTMMSAKSMGADFEKMVAECAKKPCAEINTCYTTEMQKMMMPK